MHLKHLDERGFLTKYGLFHCAASIHSSIFFGRTFNQDFEKCVLQASNFVENRYSCVLSMGTPGE